MKRKIVVVAVSFIIIFWIICGLTCLKNTSSKDIENKNSIEEKVEEIKQDTTEEIKNDKTDIAEEKEEKPKVEVKKENASTTKEQSKTEEKKTNNSVSASKKENVDNSKQDIQTQNKPVQDKPVNTEPPKMNETFVFYESITGGKKEFASDSEATARGNQIVSNELDYVLDWNEKNPDNQIQPDINYFRVYPSAKDENGKTWYYLHFFCKSGEGNDVKLKSRF